MERRDFSIEDKILGEDFGELIDEVGGKAAGLRLLREISSNYENGIELSVPSYLSFPTSHYKEIESSVGRGKLYDAVGDKSYEESRHAIKNLIDESSPAKKEITRILLRLKNAYNQNYLGFAKYHLRSSTTIEDWRNDEYFGFFDTRRINEESNVKSELKNIVVDFVIKKFYYEKFKENTSLREESLGILAMESVPKNWDSEDSEDFLHLTVNSSYPEKDSSTGYIEIWKGHRGSGVDYWPRQLVRLSPEDIEIYQASNSNIGFTHPGVEAKFEFENPFSIGNERCSMPESILRNIYDTSQRLQDLLEKPVNLEMIVSEDSTYDSRFGKYCVQMRPVPTLDLEREIKELKPLSDDFILVARTPFVNGSYKIEAPLAFPSSKIGRVSPTGFSEEVIVLDDNRTKGHRTYAPYYKEKSKALALISIDTSTALTHGFSVEPEFSERKNWKSMGLIGTDIRKYLLPSKMKNFAQNEGDFKVEMSKFPFIIESDGREGRIYFRKEYEYIAKTSYLEKDVLLAQNALEGHKRIDHDFWDNLPF